MEKLINSASYSDTFDLSVEEVKEILEDHNNLKRYAHFYEIVDLINTLDARKKEHDIAKIVLKRYSDLLIEDKIEDAKYRIQPFIYYLFYYEMFDQGEKILDKFYQYIDNFEVLISYPIYYNKINLVKKILSIDKNVNRDKALLQAYKNYNIDIIKLLLEETDKCETCNRGIHGTNTKIKDLFNCFTSKYDLHKELKIVVEYRPGGNGYLQAKNSFESKQ